MKAVLSHRTLFPGRAVALAWLLAVGACAGTPVDPAARVGHDGGNDPAEPMNRIIFQGNQWIDRNALQPVARTYQTYVPDAARNGLRNVSQNLQAPAVLVNDMLQGNMGRAWITTQRFSVNSTLGGAGLFDVASDWDLPMHRADFGQTLGVWGVGSGPDVQLPLFGSSNVRDSVGTALGFFGDPVGYVPGAQVVQLSAAAAGMVDGRARMLPVTEDLERNSMDYYATLRSVYAQRREAFIDEGRNGGQPTNGKAESLEFPP